MPAGAICVHLYNQDPQAAWQTFQDVMDVEVFANSDEAFTADALFQAYRSVRQVRVGSPHWGMWV